MNFTIKTLWNSIPISGDRHVQLVLSSTPENDHLLIEIHAPFFNDSLPLGPVGPFANLWNYEVVELFFLASSTNHYIELEFSPHGHYLVLLLTDRRKLLKDMLQLTEYRVEPPLLDRWYGRVLVPRAHFPAHIDLFNAYAIHGEDDNRIYEALYPAPMESTKPDFHRLELFQPLNFEKLLNIGDEDGDSWNNQASHSVYNYSLLFLILVLTILLWKL
ncbi:unnamed protein product [Rotaria sp. Silwood2]|nr:unnamed protein product [Rotaria sp. Silwood2]CAF2860866.1 unnamed protein product [Rotaria sp. Silwood2]CAF3335388.1 unnamed protein product [Rotaria sp. Silwood2]CAF3935431.1 unnamed protein product [Rotaria sp. Silwood2]CAF4010819.1 unnamed protein product [Rotaria sp. Silwood2]